MASRTPGPTCSASFTYGLPEFFRDAIKGSKRVAAPGCYPTAASLALKPLVEAGAIEKQGIIVDAASGVSGAGRAANAGTHFCAVDGSFRAYGLLTKHRHTAEMEMVTGAEVLFTPHLMATSRGILATCYARATGPATRWPSCARPMPASASSMSARRRPRPNGRPGPTPPSSAPATTSAPAPSSRSPRSTISARARPAR